MYWIHVDRPLKKCILHEEDCEFVRGRQETPGIGINEMRGDGGWFSFARYLDAKQFFEANVKVYGIERVKDCDVCH